MGIPRGLWLSSFATGLESQKPTYYYADTEFAFYYATDSGQLYEAVKPAAASTAPTWNAVQRSMQQFLLEDDFYGTWAIGDAGPADTWITTAGSGANTAAATTVAGSLNGEVTIKSSTADAADSANMSNFSSINLGFKANSGGLSMSCRIKLDVVATAYLFVGFTDTLASTVEAPIFMTAADIDSTATDACGILYDTDGTTDVFTLGGVKADVDTAPLQVADAPVVNTYVTLRVDVDTAGTVTGYINGVLMGSVANAVTTTVALCPIIVVGNRTAAQITATLDWIRASQNRV